MKRAMHVILALGSVFCLMLLTANASPVPYAVTLTDGNSTLPIDPGSQAGAHFWMVDNTYQLYQEWFWYRVGNAGPDKSIDTLPLVSETQSGPDQLTVKYGSAATFYVQVQFNLDGGSAGSHTADVDEQIKIINNGTSALNFHFFEYSDFDLNGTPYDKLVSMANSNAVVQTDFGGPVGMSETVTTAAQRFELNYYNNLLAELNSGLPYDLAMANMGPYPHTLGPGDLTWALQWDHVIGVDGTFLISKDKLVAPVPEPASMLLLGGGLLGVGLARLFGKRKP